MTLDEKPRLGRPPAEDPIDKDTIGLHRSTWAWVALWFPDGNRSVQLREVLDRAQKFWPQGPGRFGHAPRVKRERRMPQSKIKAYAEARGLSYRDALAEIAERFFEQVKE